MRLLSVLLAGVLLTTHPIYAEIDVERLADSIYLAEGKNISKPYGIMRDYCNNKSEYAISQCRKGCIQTINKHLNKGNYSTIEGFLEVFSQVYAPIGASNDPNNLNKNWGGNVLSIYKKMG